MPMRLPLPFRSVSQHRAIRVAGLLAAVGLFVGCKKEPVDTETSIVLAEAPPPPPAEQSRFSVPLDFDFTAVLRVVERAVPLRFGSIDSVHQAGDDTHRHFAYEADRGPFAAAAEGNLVRLRDTLSYAVKGYYKPIVGPTISAGCGVNTNVRPRLIVQLSTPLTLTQSWHLQSRAKLDTIGPASDAPQDRCNVSILRKDITPRVVEAARNGISAHLADIDRKVAEISLQSRATEWWGLLNRPIRLRDGLWLMLGPDQLAIGRVRGRGHVLRVPVTLAAHPRIVTSVDAPRVDTLPLPPLGRDTLANGFHISMDGTVDYATASDVVGKALIGRKVTQANRLVTIDTARITPLTGGRIALTVTFHGDAMGTLRFIGTPVYDPKHNEIRVPNLDYDLATDNNLINTYSWLKSDDLRATFREHAHVPVAPAIDKGKELLLLGLNRKIGSVMTLSATVDSVAVKGLYVTRGGIVVRAIATGQAAVSVKQQ